MPINPTQRRAVEQYITDLHAGCGNLFQTSVPIGMVLADVLAVLGWPEDEIGPLLAGQVAGPTAAVPA